MLDALYLSWYAILVKTHGRYSSFSSFLRTRREAKYRSARDFSVRVKLEVSYPQYSRYEAGEQLPSLSQALAIGDALQVDTVEMTLEWSLSQAQGESADKIRSHLESVRAGKSPSAYVPPTLPFPLDEVIVFNRSHRDLFLTDPKYRDVFTYVNAFDIEHGITVEAISKALDLKLETAKDMLNALSQLGVMVKEKDRYFAAKKNYYFPDDADFFELRQQNMRHNVETILNRLTHGDLIQKRAMRTVGTRELTAEQAGWIMGQTEGLMKKFLELPEDPTAEKVYSFCALVGERFSR